ncbi:MAG: type II toxin-antitoxin system Phd/YefM family antitoxin [Deltaproteobacteria bacterium]|nr:type II toxin-antitoxin system Phd/YefM family antitoxin [Deltaproteobacteria bacterium]
MTTTVDINKAKTQLPKLLSLALKGNEVVITEHDKPRARIVPVAAAAGMRTAGLHKGKIKTSRDFDAPLTDGFWTGEE